MRQFQDQMGRSVSLDVYPPKRIISLVPSQTELLYDLGLEAEVVGITKFCIHPSAWYKQKDRVGGTKTVSPEKLAALAPDLIIGNKEENTREQIELLATQYPVWMSDVYTLADAFDMIRQIGMLTGKSARANTLAQKIQLEFEQNPPSWTTDFPRVAYFIWRKPYIAVGQGTFIDFMLREAGFENVFHAQARYPEVNMETLREMDPDLIFLSSEPFPFAEKHFDVFQQACPKAKIKLVDGEMFSWYGSRLQEVPRYFQQLRESIG